MHTPGTVHFPAFFTSLPKISRLPALVAGFTRVFTMHTPGTVHFPAFFTSLLTTPAKLSKSLDTSVFFNSVSSAKAWASPPLDKALAPFIAFIAFIGAMAGSTKRRSQRERRSGAKVGGGGLEPK